MPVRRLCAAAIFVTVLLTAGPRLWPGHGPPVRRPGDEANTFAQLYPGAIAERERPLAPGPAAPLGRDWREAVRTGVTPRQTKHVDPLYPEAARQARIEGAVIVEMLIDEGGRVRDVRVLRSVPLLDQAAIDAVRQWQFTPTLIEERAVKVIMTATVSFAISD